MQKQKQLNLLIIDDNQLYAEHLVGLLEKHYYKQVNLGFLDAKDELKRALKEYKGSILMVCHEPEFYDGLATQVWDLSQWTTKL